MADDWVAVPQAGVDDWAPAGGASAPGAPAQAPPKKPPYHVFGDKPMDPVFGTVAAPALNFLTGPVRGLVADVLGMAPGIGGVPITGEGRQQWWDARARIMEATEVPETDIGKTVSRGLAIPGKVIGQGIEKASRAVIGNKATEAIAPFATTAVDAAAVVPALHDVMASKVTQAADKWVDKAYGKAVGPRPSGRDTPAQRRDAISSIINDKAVLQYTDTNGSVIASGRLPQSLDEFSQAVDQSKSRLFNEWNQLSTQAGISGAMVDLTPVVRELRGMAVDPSLQRTNPAAARYAERLADRYQASARIRPEEAQRDLVALNQKLRGYYKTPMPIAPAEEIAARILRQELDRTIESAVAPGYQELRNRYTSLRAIEDDVDRAARRVGNWRAGGGVFSPLVNTTSIMAGAEGIWHGDWKGIAAGATTKALGELHKARNHPNAIVKRIFEKAENLQQQRQKPPSQIAAPSYITGSILEAPSALPSDSPF